MSDQSDPIKPWTIKGIPPEDRNAAMAAAKRTGQNIGEFVRRAIRQTIQSDRKVGSMPAVIPSSTVAIIPSEPETASLLIPADPPDGPTGVRLHDRMEGLEVIERLSAVVKQVAEATGEPPPKTVSRMLYAGVREQLQQMRPAPQRKQIGSDQRKPESDFSSD